jgi:hypothetical protein
MMSSTTFASGGLAGIAALRRKINQLDPTGFRPLRCGKFSAKF